MLAYVDCPQEDTFQRSSGSLFLSIKRGETTVDRVFELTIVYCWHKIQTLRSSVSALAFFLFESVMDRDRPLKVSYKYQAQLHVYRSCWSTSSKPNHELVCTQQSIQFDGHPKRLTDGTWFRHGKSSQVISSHPSYSGKASRMSEKK